MPAPRPKKRSTKSRKAAPARQGLGLPGFRILIPAALIAGGWAVMQDISPFWQDDKPKRPQTAVSTPARPERPEARQRTVARETSRDLSPKTGPETNIVPAIRPRVDVAANSPKTPSAAPRPAVPVTTPVATPTAKPPTEMASADPRPPAKPIGPEVQPIVPAGKLLYASVQVELHMQASDASEIVAILPRGAAVKLLASRDEWRLVSTSRRLGWVHRDQLEESTASIRRPAAALDGPQPQLARK